MNSLISILKTLSVINRDNGSVFTETGRLDAIANLLKGSKYKKVETDGLFHLYSACPVEELKGPVIIVSSHVDCERHITRFFSEQRDEHTLLGTFDNSITNAAITYLMLKGSLPVNVLTAFTGDEEEEGRGANDVTRFIKKHRLDVLNIFVLDVTEEGWFCESDFTIENDFWDDDFGEKAVSLANRTGLKWKYVPADLSDIPDYIPRDKIVRTDAYSDESWDYDEADIPCFSFCLPTNGDMHCDSGILARVNSFENYTAVLERMLKELF